MGANITFHDPLVSQWSPAEHEEPLYCVPDLEAAAREADLVVLLPPHSAYELTRVAKAARLLLDTRGVLEVSDHVRRL